MRTGSSSLNFFQALFTRVVTVISQPPPAESMSPRYQKEATTNSQQGNFWCYLSTLVIAEDSV